MSSFRKSLAHLYPFTTSRPLILSGLLSFLILSIPSHASSLDLGFSPDVQGTVNSIAIQRDEKILVGGAFSLVDGVTRNRIVRLNSDGSVDSTFHYDESVLLQVLAIAVQADDKIVIGGTFISSSGPVRRRIARLNANGTLDTSFTPIILSGDGQSVSSIAVQADGKILIAGDFSGVQGTGEASSTNRNNIARLNADGTIDTGFDPNVDGFINTVNLQADGKILIGGGFTSLFGTGATTATSRSRFARLHSDGTVDTSFNPGFNNTVRAAALQADGKILVGGGFTTATGTGDVGTTTRNRIARLEADGQLDANFNPNSNGNVESIALQADGGILLSGQFTNIGGINRSRIARLQSSGVVDGDVDTGLTVNGFIWVTNLQANGMILVGGFFSEVADVSRSNLARIDTNAAPAISVRVNQDGSQVDWTRGGNAPSLSRSTLELSEDGTSWASPVHGNRSHQGWVFNGLTIPLNNSAYLRLRGYYGQSQSVTEQVERVRVPVNDSGPCIPVKASNKNTVLICLE